jgi:hypothetical protein
MNVETNYAVVFVNSAHGYNHINTRIDMSSKDDLESVSAGNLPYTSSFDSISGSVVFNAQYNATGDDFRKPYGFEPALGGMSNFDLRKAERALKLLRKVSKKYDALRNESRNYDFIPSLVAFLKSAGIKRVFIRYQNANGFVNLGLEEAIYELTKIDQKFQNGSRLIRNFKTGVRELRKISLVM